MQTTTKQPTTINVTPVEVFKTATATATNSNALALAVFGSLFAGLACFALADTTTEPEPEKSESSKYIKAVDGYNYFLTMIGQNKYRLFGPNGIICTLDRRNSAGLDVVNNNGFAVRRVMSYKDHQQTLSDALDHISDHRLFAEVLPWAIHEICSLPVYSPGNAHTCPVPSGPTKTAEPSKPVEVHNSYQGDSPYSTITPSGAIFYITRCANDNSGTNKYRVMGDNGVWFYITNNPSYGIDIIRPDASSLHEVESFEENKDAITDLFQDVDDLTLPEKVIAWAINVVNLEAWYYTNSDAYDHSKVPIDVGFTWYKNPSGLVFVLKGREFTVKNYGLRDLELIWDGRLDDPRIVQSNLFGKHLQYLLDLGREATLDYWEIIAANLLKVAGIKT